MRVVVAQEFFDVTDGLLVQTWIRFDRFDSAEKATHLIVCILWQRGASIKSFFSKQARGGRSEGAELSGLAVLIEPKMHLGKELRIDAAVLAKELAQSGIVKRGENSLFSGGTKIGLAGALIKVREHAGRNSEVKGPWGLIFKHGKKISLDCPVAGDCKGGSLGSQLPRKKSCRRTDTDAFHVP